MHDAAQGERPNATLHPEANLSGGGDDPFSSPFWDLTQTWAWAYSRDPEAVRFAAIDLRTGQGPKMIAVKTFADRCRLCQLSQGFDVLSDLWARSGIDKERFGYPQMTLTADGPVLAGRSDHFSVEHHLLTLLQAGKLTASSGSPDGRGRAILAPVDWADHNITTGGSSKRLLAFRGGVGWASEGQGDYVGVMLARTDVLTVFPPLGLGENAEVKTAAEKAAAEPCRVPPLPTWHVKTAEQLKSWARRDEPEAEARKRIAIIGTAPSEAEVCRTLLQMLKELPVTMPWMGHASADSIGATRRKA